MINILNEMEGLDYFLKSSTFDIKSFLNLTPSSFPAIQSQALQILNQVFSITLTLPGPTKLNRKKN